jgi:hypothetical protein
VRPRQAQLARSPAAPARSLARLLGRSL